MKLNLIMKKKKKSENAFEKIKNNLTKQVDKLTDNLNKSEINSNKFLSLTSLELSKIDRKSVV